MSMTSEPALVDLAVRFGAEGVEPIRTNCSPERALRHGVLWRHTSFGTHSLAGSRFVERMLTVRDTLRQQQRNVLDYLTLACQASRRHQTTTPADHGLGQSSGCDMLTNQPSSRITQGRERLRLKST